MTLETLNSSVFLPRKDPSAGNLMYPSPLLVSSGTVVFVDETDMSEGSLLAAGVKSFQVLRLPTFCNSSVTDSYHACYTHLYL